MPKGAGWPQWARKRVHYVCGKRYRVRLHRTLPAENGEAVWGELCHYPERVMHVAMADDKIQPVDLLDTFWHEYLHIAFFENRSLRRLLRSEKDEEALVHALAAAMAVAAVKNDTIKGISPSGRLVTKE